MIESTTLAGGIRVPAEPRCDVVTSGSKSHGSELSPLSQSARVAIPASREENYRVVWKDRDVKEVAKVVDKIQHNSPPRLCAVIVETRSDAALRLTPGASLPFRGGVSSGENREGITISRDGTAFSVTTEGLYRLVLELEVIEGAPSVLKVECDTLPPECSNISVLKLKGNCEQQRSTILSFRPGHTFSLVNRGESSITIAPEARLQVYRVG